MASTTSLSKVSGLCAPRASSTIESKDLPVSCSTSCPLGFITSAVVLAIFGSSLLNTMAKKAITISKKSRLIVIFRAVSIPPHVPLRIFLNRFVFSFTGKPQSFQIEILTYSSILAFAEFLCVLEKTRIRLLMTILRPFFSLAI